VPCGQRVAKRDRQRWQMKVSEYPKIGVAAVAVASRLATKYARANGEAWPSIQTLARDLGISENTVKRALNRLHLAGFVDVRSGRKAGRVNVYTLTWPAPIETNVLQLRP
jgi:DNA-binding transcriptional MocR family regulator